MIQPPETILCLSIFCLVLTLSFSASDVFNVENYGAVSGGTEDSSKGFLGAWDAACASGSASTVYVPTGVFLIGTSITFDGKDCPNSITFKIDGTIIAPSDYNAIGNNENWIVFRYANWVTLTGGVLDGQGENLWKCKGSENFDCPKGANSMAFYHSNNVQINGVTSINSQHFHILVYNSNNVGLQSINITAPGDSPNTDGIHVQSSSIVNILSSHISTGDDCISMGPGTSSVWIEDIFCGPGHGISIGSLGKEATEDGVHNVTVQSSTLQGTENGIRIKTWARPSSGFVSEVTYRNITMINSENPIIIDQNYSPDSDDYSSQASGIKISSVTYQEIHGTSASDVAISMACSSVEPCINIILQDINLTYGSQPAQASCSNVQGSANGTVVPSGCV